MFSHLFLSDGGILGEENAGKQNEDNHIKFSWCNVINVQSDNVHFVLGKKNKVKQQSADPQNAL